MANLFKNATERIANNSSDFIELQYCKMHSFSFILKKISVNSIKHWSDDSLYIALDDVEIFLSNYSEIFSKSIHNNLRKGELDVYGINYFSRKKVKNIIHQIEVTKPLEYEIILDWLKMGRSYNGFYCLGV